MGQISVEISGPNGSVLSANQHPRLWENLLSSQGMTFNLFARASADRAYATRLFAELFPDLIAEVHSVAFEHSPGRNATSSAAESIPCKISRRPE
jgi:hypothetical protein